MVRLMGMVAVLILLVGVACGDDDDDNGNGGSTSPTATTAAAATQEDEAEPTEADSNGGADVEGDASNGQTLAQSKGCIACHSVDGSALVGPTWQGLWMSEVTLEGGETVTADADYIRNSILSPNDQVVEGFPPTMPSFEGQLSDEEIADITAYIASLE